MTLYEIWSAIFTYLTQNWTYTSIRETNKDDAPALPFIELHFNPGQMIPLEIQGAGERVGTFAINIFTAKGVGIQQGITYGGKLEVLFNHKTISGVTCESGTLLPHTKFRGIDEALQACHHQTIIPFSIITEI